MKDKKKQSLIFLALLPFYFEVRKKEARPKGKKKLPSEFFFKTPKKKMSLLRWSEVGRLCFYALGGATVCGALGLATIVTEKKIGRQLLIPTDTVHKHENLRCWLTELENIVLPQCQVIYLRLLGNMDQITSAEELLKSSPKELDKMFSARIMSTYISMANESCSRMIYEFETKNKDAHPAKCEDMRKLLTNIKKAMYQRVTSILLMCRKYPQVTFTFDITEEEKT